MYSDHYSKLNAGFNPKELTYIPASHRGNVQDDSNFYLFQKKEFKPTFRVAENQISQAFLEAWSNTFSESLCGYDQYPKEIAEFKRRFCDLFKHHLSRYAVMNFLANTVKPFDGSFLWTDPQTIQNLANASFMFFKEEDGQTRPVYASVCAGSHYYDIVLLYKRSFNPGYGNGPRSEIVFFTRTDMRAIEKLIDSLDLQDFSPLQMQTLEKNIISCVRNVEISGYLFAEDIQSVMTDNYLLHSGDKICAVSNYRYLNRKSRQDSDAIENKPEQMTPEFRRIGNNSRPNTISCSCYYVQYRCLRPLV